MKILVFQENIELYLNVLQGNFRRLIGSVQAVQQRAPVTGGELNILIKY